MRLVPVEVALVALPAPTARRLAPALVRLGSRVEVDLERLDGDLRDAVASYLRVLRAARPGGPQVSLDVTLVDVRQSTSKEAPRDLSGELEALSAVQALRPLLLLLDASPPDAVPGVRVDRTPAGLLRGSVRASSALWPAELGGPPSPREVSRLVRVTASHARWRDRRLRRLVRVEAVSRQAWPSPEGGV